MNMKKRTNSILIINFFAMFVVFLTNLLFNSWICEGNRAFYMDDLSLMTNYSNKTFLEFVFSHSANKIRPVSHFFIWCVAKLAGHNYEIIDIFLLLLNYANALLVYMFSLTILHTKKYADKVILACICAIMFIASRLAYYNISEVFGIMEGIAIGLAIGMLLMLYMFMDSGKIKYFGLAVILYTLLIYVHERYFILFFLFIVSLLFNKEMRTTQKWKAIIAPFIVFVSYWVIRALLFGDRAVDGTGGTSIGDTFNFLTAVKFCFSQVGYILDFNCGPTYLNGITASQVPLQINILLLFNVIVVLGIAFLYFSSLIKDKICMQDNFKIFILFITFIGLCIICSSTTIRVEMRWIYVSYTAFLIMFFHMISVLLEYHPVNLKKTVLFSIYLISVLITEQFYRSHYTNIYYWELKDFSREIYDVTIGKYGTELEGKNIIIVGDFWKNAKRESVEWKKFFSLYLNAELIDVIYVKDIYEASQLADEYADSIVLLEDKETRRYVDITDKMNLRGVVYIYGIYDDLWCDMVNGG